MTSFNKKIAIRWADLDPNFHVRHSVYYDFGAQQRVEILTELGLSLDVMQTNNFGPILFREECVFRKEIRIGQDISIEAKMAKLNADASRWTIRHLFLNTENKVCATLTLDGTWLDTSTRKLLNPIPDIIQQVMHSFPKTEDFVMT